jgi:hypothetical protein
MSNATCDIWASMNRISCSTTVLIPRPALEGIAIRAAQPPANVAQADRNGGEAQMHPSCRSPSTRFPAGLRAAVLA